MPDSDREVLLDTQTGLTWVNGTGGCHSPADHDMVITKMDAVTLCENTTHAGIETWRAPTAEEISEMIASATEAGVQLNYINPACPAMVASDGFVRTENDSTHPGGPGTILAAQTLDELGSTAGVRCVTDQTRFESLIAGVSDGGGQTLIDHMKQLQWVNDTQLDSNGDGCVSPANVGPTEPSQAQSRCENQNFAGFNDWRAPTADELSILIRETQTAGVKLNYLNAGCPALVGSDGIVQTENTPNPNGGQPGDILGAVLADLPTGTGVPGEGNAGVRCVRDL
jgi:hypothetical protein